jgi:endonuclease/exonuclease/phosphatase family metal-dependent hydrolase
LGYLDRGFERVDVDIDGNKIAILNIHLEAWEVAAREDQIKITSNYINEINMPVILGGDFNTVPPDAPKKSSFIDDKDADYTKETTLQWFFANAKGMITPTITAPNQTNVELYTYPSNNPDRRLDFIFLFGKTLSFIDFRVVGEAGTASDHLPVMARIKYRD